MIQKLSVYMNVPDRFAEIPAQIIDRSLNGFAHTEVRSEGHQPELESARLALEESEAICRALGTTAG